MRHRHKCPECGHVHTPEPCQHENVKPEAGDYGRRPHAFEVCQDCKYTWAMESDGARKPLGVFDPITGVYSGP